jgi:hypothetical protein
LNHSLERSLRVFPLRAASCPLDWGFFILFPPGVETRDGPFWALVSTLRKTLRMTNPAIEGLSVRH